LVGETAHHKAAGRRFARGVPHVTARAIATRDVSLTGDNGVADNFMEIAMNTIVSAMIALAVLAGLAAPASALDAKQTSSERQDRASQAPVGGFSSGETLVW
jgi:hypothetical protein